LAEINWLFPPEIVHKVSEHGHLMPREKKFICEKILSGATPLRTIPQLCKANEGCKAFG
jgi:hypothetical protein